MNKFVLWIVKITGVVASPFYYKKKIYCEGNDKHLRHIRGKALLISNHTSVWDFPLMMFTFFFRDLYVLVAEVIFNKSRFMSHFMKHIGGIRVDRNQLDFAFISKMTHLLKKKKACLIYPEGRIPDTREMIDFKPSYVYIALASDAPIIPIYTNGCYGKTLRKERHDRCKVMIGKPINCKELYDINKTEKENIDIINAIVKDKIRSLKEELEKK